MIRCLISAVVEGVIKRFSASGRVDETFESREYFQHYGFTSRPKANAEGIIINAGNHYIMIASDDRRYRIALEDGEAALYDDLGQRVHLTRHGIEAVSPMKISATAPLVEVIASEKVTFTTPLVEISGDLEVAGDVSDGVRTMAADRAIYNGHRHGGSPEPDAEM